jgi:hypothetical protein
MIVKTFNSEYQYVLDAEKELAPKDQTVWVYKLPLLEDQYHDTGRVSMPVNVQKEEIKSAEWKAPHLLKKYDNIIKKCLIRVENLKDEQGNIVEWPSANQPQKEFIAILPKAVRTELGRAFGDTGFLTKAQEKNSS